jgi:hypothetical protein
MKTCAALVLRRFHVALDPTRPEPVPTVELTLKAQAGIWLNFTPL